MLNLLKFAIILTLVVAVSLLVVGFSISASDLL